MKNKKRKKLEFKIEKTERRKEEEAMRWKDKGRRRELKKIGF